MDIQTIIAYLIVAWAFGMAARAVYKAIRGEKSLPKCPGCKDESCGINDVARSER
jgi:hypothetical protein